MSAGHSNIHHLDIPDRGELYESGVRVVIVRDQDGIPFWSAEPWAPTSSCPAIERNATASRC